MEMDLPIAKKRGTESDIFMELPPDYNNWSSTVIFFKENEDDVSVYAFDSDDCILYYVVSYQRLNFFYKELGYTAGDFKVYFVGDAIVDDVITYSDEVKVYDIPTRKWEVDFPKLNSPKSSPFVFFFDGKLYVLSCGGSCKGSHFEMLDLNNSSQGWVTLFDEPFFVWQDLKACQNPMIIDYTKKMLYIRLVEFSCVDCKSDLYSWDSEFQAWDTVDTELYSYREANLWKASWSDECAIVDNQLYGFQMFQYDGHRRAILVVRDLEHEIKVRNNSVELDFVDVIHSDDDLPIPGQWEVNISHIVTEEVLQDLYAIGYLVYLGKKSSFLRFSLVILYSCRSCSGAYHVCTSTFELGRKSRNLNEETAARESSTELFIANSVCCNTSHVIIIDPSPLVCKKLCEVKDYLTDQLTATVI